MTEPIKFFAGDLVPTWIECVEPSRYQPFLLFASDVSVLRDGEGVKIRTTRRVTDSVMRFRPQWWRRFFPIHGLTLVGAPTKFYGVASLAIESSSWGTRIITEPAKEK